MASFSERISVIIDVTTNKAVSGLKDFKSAVGEAQGFTGKLKAGVGSLASTFGAALSSPAGMAAAVATAGKVAFDAVSDYAALGVQVADFAAATGLSTEAASRWTEVSGDLGIEVGTLQAAMGKLNKSIDPDLFKRLGVEIAHTSDGATDVNQTFLNVVDRLRAIKDPAEQARVGAQLLGKGWQSVAPLISRSAEDIKNQLNSVSKVKVFSKDDTAKAQQFDAAMNDLKDVAQELALRLGQDLLPVLADTLGPLADLAAGFQDLKDEGYLPPSGLELNNELRDFIANALFSSDAIEYTGKAVTNFGDSAAGSARYLGLLAEHTRESADAASDLSGKAGLAKAQLKLLQDQIEGRKSFIDLQVQLKDNADKIAKLAEDFRKGKITAQEYYLGVASSALDSQSAVAGYVDTIDSIPQTKKLEMVATLDPASPGAIVDDIQTALNNANFAVNAETNIENRRGATGGVMTPGTVNITVHAPVGANMVEAGRQIANALQAYYRAGGNRLS